MFNTETCHDVFEHAEEFERERRITRKVKKLVVQATEILKLTLTKRMMLENTPTGIVNFVTRFDTNPLKVYTRKKHRVKVGNLEQEE
ncbi:hypothetical protein R6Q59_011465 [Mikania micrantha]